MDISVVIPTHNRPRKLVRCVRSVFSQTHRPDEIVIVDDASSTEYEGAIGKLNSESKEIHVDYHRLDESQKASHARNVGAHRARGDLLMFIDDDDTWEPQKVEGQLEAFSAHPEAGLVYSGRNAVDEQGNVLYKIAPVFSGPMHQLLLQKNHIGATSSVALTADVFRKSGGFDESLPAMQDYDLWIRATQHTEVAYDPRHTVNWTIHASSGNQMTGKPRLYESACRQLREKYASEFRALSRFERRKAYASQYTILADKYARSGSRLQYVYAMRSFFQMPSLAALSRLLPYDIWMKIRTKM